MDIKKIFDDLTSLDLARLTIPGWILILIAIGVSCAAGCTMALLSISAANEVAEQTGRGRYSLVPAGLVFVVLLAGIFYGGSWGMKQCGIEVLRERRD